jgi:carbonic anhydrase
MVQADRALATTMKLVNNGRGVMSAIVRRKHRGISVIDVGGRVLRVREVRFHSPSEHSIRGTRFPLEAQIVTQDDARDKVILSVFFLEGQENQSLGKIWEDFEAFPGVVKAKRAFSVAGILPSDGEGADGQYYTYQGSDSRPPCRENVEWILFKNPQFMSPRQLSYFKLRANAVTSRAVQPRFNRVVRISAKSPPLGLPPNADTTTTPR